MEQYLIDQYNVIEDTDYLKTEEDIIEYFEDFGDRFECGQGYCEDEKSFICKIEDKFYLVNLYAEIGSAKQEYGDRLYWIESIERVEYEEISKPMLKETFRVDGVFVMTEQQYKNLQVYLEESKIAVDSLEKVE